MPVVVYIHGGANVSGSSQNDVYDGTEISKKGVVYVSINYRVGIFGFLAYKDKTGEEVTGNFAIQDQIAALQWVKKNISKFGAFHTSDVNYWLNHFTKIYPRNFTAVDYALGDTMSSYIVNFAKTGNPNGLDGVGRTLPIWNEVNQNSNISYLHIGNNIQFTEMETVKSNFWKNISK